MSNKRTNRSIQAAVAVAALMLTSACSGAESPSASASTATGDVKIYVIGGKSDDPFWSKVKRGAEDAGTVVSAGGGSVTWLGPQNYDNLGPDAAKLIDSAISQGASAVVGADWVPEAQDDAFKRVVAKGIPLLIYNAGGLDAADRLGAINYVGSEEYTAGKAGGAAFGTAGAKHVLCVNTLPGASNTEERCRGIADGIAASGGKSTQLPLPSSSFGNPTAIAQGVKGALLNDATIDGVITIGSSDADAAVSGIEQAGSKDKVKFATFDMDEAQLQRIKDGGELFCIDQQPYMQGYLAVSMLNSYVRYGIKLPQRPLLTGPAIIDAQNVDSAITGAKAGVR